MSSARIDVTVVLRYLSWSVVTGITCNHLHNKQHISLAPHHITPTARAEPTKPIEMKIEAREVSDRALYGDLVFAFDLLAGKTISANCPIMRRRVGSLLKAAINLRCLGS